MKKAQNPRKDVRWLGNSLEELRTWSKSVTECVGSELLLLQEGKDPSDWKPMVTIGVGVSEIRVRDDGQQYRLIYVAKFEEAIYVIHVFRKKTQKTSKRDLELAKKRYIELVNSRKQGEK